MLVDLHAKLNKFSDEFEAVINMAGAYYPPNNEKYLKENKISAEEHPSLIGNMNCFDEYEKIQQAEFLSTMLTVHLASDHLSPTGYVLFMGSENAISTDPKKGMPMEKIAKGTVMQQALNLSAHKVREDVIYGNTNINTFICKTLI